VCRRDQLPRRVDRICGSGPGLAKGTGVYTSAEARIGMWVGEQTGGEPSVRRSSSKRR
jgi:hypothetical protein